LCSNSIIFNPNSFKLHQNFHHCCCLPCICRNCLQKIFCILGSHASCVQFFPLVWLTLPFHFSNFLHCLLCERRDYWLDVLTNANFDQPFIPPCCHVFQSSSHRLWNFHHYCWHHHQDCFVTSVDLIVIGIWRALPLPVTWFAF
jgi:hypothetical protein